MQEYEKLLSLVEEENIYLIETDKIEPLKGLYFDNHIVINSNINTIAEKKCILAEELGHHYKNIGNILDITNLRNLKQENLGRSWAYNYLIGINNLIEAYKNNVKNRYELSQYLNITEEFIEEALKYYQRKYGIYHKHKNYIIYFNPLYVLEVWE